MRTTYILDTSVLIHDPNSFKSFKGSSVIIPINVLNELDKLKTFPNEAGKNARVCIRALDKICQSGNIHKGIKIGSVTVKIDSTAGANKFGPDSYVDNTILTCATTIKAASKKLKTPSKIVLVSRDINLRVRAQALGVEAIDYTKDKVAATDLYIGHKRIISSEFGSLLQTNEYLDVSCYDELKDLHPNECVYFESERGGGTAIGRRIGDRVYVIRGKKLWGLESRNKEQAFAMDLLCDSKLPLVTLIGQAGTGKTIVTLAAGLELVLSQKKYSKLVIYRPIQPVGNDIGFLPGSLEEKLEPWMQAIYDGFEHLLESKSGLRWRNQLNRYLEDGTIEMQAITYIRGRSIQNALIVIDEAQNLSREEIKTILTRAGNNSKIVLTGDIEQIDKSSLDATNNGLSYVVEKFKTSDLAGHVTFQKGERSLLATKAAEIL